MQQLSANGPHWHAGGSGRKVARPAAGSNDDGVRIVALGLEVMYLAYRDTYIAAGECLNERRHERSHADVAMVLNQQRRDDVAERGLQTSRRVRVEKVML